MSIPPIDPPRIISQAESEFRHDVWGLHVQCARPTWRITRHELLTAIKKIGADYGRSAEDVIDALNEADVVFELAESRFTRSSLSLEDWLRIFPEVRK